MRPLSKQHPESQFRNHTPGATFFPYKLPENPPPQLFIRKATTGVFRRSHTREDILEVLLELRALSSTQMGGADVRTASTGQLKTCAATAKLISGHSTAISAASISMTTEAA